MNVDALNAACQHFGSQKKLADKLGIQSPAISSWRRTGLIPAEQCRAIELFTHGQVTRADLHPFLFGPIPELDNAPSPAG